MIDDKIFKGNTQEIVKKPNSLMQTKLNFTNAEKRKKRRQMKVDDNLLPKIKIVDQKSNNVKDKHCDKISDFRRNKLR